MPRQARIDAPGILHHVMIRGIERRKIFKDDQDRQDLIERLEILLPETRISCYAWSLMPNHAHFLFRTGDVPLATLMRRLLTGYVVSFNRRYKRQGQLFQNRYKSIICQEDKYLKELVRYIHLNPFRAKLVASFAELNTYQYSGHATLIGNMKKPWQETNYVLSYFGKSIHSARKNYLSFVENGLNQGRRFELVGGGLIRSSGGWKAIKQNRGKAPRAKGDQRILGESEFVADVLSQANEKFDRSYELKSKGYDLNFIEKKVCHIFSIEKDQIYQAGRRQIVADARGIFCYWAVHELGYTPTEIARRLNRTVPAIVYAVRRGEKLAKDYSLFG